MRTRSLLALGCTLLWLTACNAPKHVAYFQYDSRAGEATTAPSSEPRIKPKDLLSITVTASNNEATKVYNLFVPQSTDYSSTSLYSQPTIQKYLVEDDGTIDFPTLGRIAVVGKTKDELESYLLEQIRPAFNEEVPIITISITNYTVSVLGEVARPGRITVPNERITVLEALAQAGDMTLYGNRKTVKVLREEADGTKRFLPVDLNDQALISSPAYYLQQNDVVYVEPNTVRKRTAGIGSAETLSISIVSTFISIASLLVNILN